MALELRDDGNPTADAERGELVLPPQVYSDLLASDEEFSSCQGARSTNSVTKAIKKQERMAAANEVRQSLQLLKS